ncbi:hypothetical protein BT67DRAFT_229756 [Trichocladium antarcticum]|uniref:Uncharacterized protein n=1 Tax=Trichocladium antarcticum TaxID=1450529 RepID=A0AAN6UQF9_9PEZI|nr:hypothetical protein BT67DRAFT_229756 [Trichocladium antarcticum]
MAETKRQKRQHPNPNTTPISLNRITPHTTPPKNRNLRRPQIHPRKKEGNEQRRHNRRRSQRPPLTPAQPPVVLLLRRAHQQRLQLRLRRQPPLGPHGTRPVREPARREIKPAQAPTITTTTIITVVIPPVAHRQAVAQRPGLGQGVHRRDGAQHGGLDIAQQADDADGDAEGDAQGRDVAVDEAAGADDGAVAD